MLLQSSVSQLHSVPLPHFNVSDAALVSSGDVTLDNQLSYSADAMDVAWNYYTLPPSPPASVSSNMDDSPRPHRALIGAPFTPESQSSEGEQHSCLPTSQVFDLDNVEAPSSSPSLSPPPSIPRQLILSSDGIPLKRAFCTIGGVKKGRGSGERITTKDFVPPDVTGLNKREARLLKNRAAAFLSRQRKREEFEAMEIRVKELEEENSRLQAVVEKGKKYDDLLLNMEQLRSRLSAAEKRERELTVELANQSMENLALKTKPHDLDLSPMSYMSYAAVGQPSVIGIMKQSLISLLPSILSLPPQTSLPITYSIPLTNSISSKPSSAAFTHHSASCDIMDQGRPRYGQGFHSSSADPESLKKLAIGGEPFEARQLDMDSLHCPNRFSISFDALPSEDGRGCVRVHVSEKISKPTIHGNRQRPLPLSSASWPGADASFAMTCYASPPLSAPSSTPSPGSMDHLGLFTGTGNVHPRMGFDTNLTPSGYPSFAQHDPEQMFDYYPGLILE